MGGLIQQSPVQQEREATRFLPFIVVAVVLVLAVLVAIFFRSQPKAATGPPPYAANLKLSDFKMSAAENFVGATVSYIDGTVTNTGPQTVTHVVVEVVFKDEMGQLAQREDVALKVVKSNGAYPEPVDLSASPLAPGQSQPFRLTFESISTQWNHRYPDIQITGVTVR